MKGFCPKSSSPMQKLGDATKADGSSKSAIRIVAENRLLQLTDVFRKPKDRRGVYAHGGPKRIERGKERRRKAIARQDKKEMEEWNKQRLSHPQKPIGSVDPAAPVAPRPFPTTYDPLSIQEQQLIAQSISKMGGFGTVDRRLIQGYGDLSSPTGRKRMQKLNAYHHYMTTRADTPEQAAKNREDLHQTLSRLEDKRRTSNFLGARNRSYDKYGRPIAELQDKYRKQVRDSIGVDPKTGRLIVSKVPLTEKQRMERDYPELAEQVRRRRRRRTRNGS